MTARFEHTTSAQLVEDADIADLAGPRWRLALTRLYLSVGVYMPEDAKRHGASFGFCDSEGFQLPRSDATHFGWTASTGSNTEAF